MAGVYHDPVLMTGITISDGAFDQFSPGNTDPGVLLIDKSPVALRLALTSDLPL